MVRDVAILNRPRSTLAIARSRDNRRRIFHTSLNDGFFMELEICHFIFLCFFLWEFPTHLTALVMDLFDFPRLQIAYLSSSENWIISEISHWASSLSAATSRLFDLAHRRRLSSSRCCFHSWKTRCEEKTLREKPENSLAKSSWNGIWRIGCHISPFAFHIFNIKWFLREGRYEGWRQSRARADECESFITSWQVE